MPGRPGNRFASTRVSSGTLGVVNKKLARVTWQVVPRQCEQDRGGDRVETSPPRQLPHPQLRECPEGLQPQPQVSIASRMASRVSIPKWAVYKK